ncbi:MAG: MlaD family protein [Terrimicrobiaceae bacterium]|nr:MlaD family protein [Terrimicrobiaceae bacterium]
MKEASYFRIGVFIIAGLLLLAGALIIFGIGQFFKEKIRIETYVDATVQGIEVGSPVKFRGVTVGKVSSIGFLFTEYPEVDRSTVANYVVILMELDKEIFPDMFKVDNLQVQLDRSIARGLRVQIEPQGITGLNYMEINYLDQSRFQPLKINWKPRNYFLPYAPGELTNLLDSVNKMMKEVENLNIKGISEDTQKLLKNLNDVVTGAQLEKLSADAQKLFGTVSKAVDDAKVKELSADTRALLNEVQKSNDQLRTILGNVEPASRLNADDIAATLANLRIISENLRAASAEISRDPSRIIFSKPPRPSKVMEPPAKPPRKP